MDTSTRQQKMSVSAVHAPPFVEIVQIHQCLRMEVTELARMVAQARKDVSIRQEVLMRFEALKSIYESHSKAEDEIIFPELQARGLSIDACAELDKQHNGQHDAFVRLEQVLRSWSDDAAILADELRASIVLHLRMEEEELLPLLDSNFQKHELGFLVGRVIGDRSSEVMEAIIHMLGRNLPPETVQSVIADFMQAANGTNFAHWMDQKRKESERGLIEGPGGFKQKGEVLPHVRLGVEHNATATFSPTSGTFGCSHYQRGLKLWASCCQKLYTCTRCHDEAVGHSHQMDVSSKQAWCMNCSMFQANPGSKCANCDSLFGTYSCRSCGIWECNPNVHVYHCPYCDVCRVGSGLGEDFFHCMRCNACVSTKMRYHKCVEGTLDRECPVCCETLFSTTRPVHYVRCGHLIHRDCFQKYLAHDYRCASCRYSMVDMSSTWRKLEQLIASQGNNVFAAQQLQSPASHSAKTRCNDCGKNSVPAEGPVGQFVSCGLVTLKVGEQCQSCGSFNTV